MNYKQARIATDEVVGAHSHPETPEEAQMIIDRAENRFVRTIGRFPYRAERGYIRNVARATWLQKGKK